MKPHLRQNPYWGFVERLPLFALHAMLERAERAIDEYAAEVGGDFEHNWKAATTIAQVERTLWFSDETQYAYYQLACIVVDREQRELAAWFAENGRAA